MLYRYALDVNVERAEDVLTHQRLLYLAEDPANRPVFEVRLVQVLDDLFCVYLLIVLNCYSIIGKRLYAKFGI